MAAPAGGPPSLPVLSWLHAALPAFAVRFLAIAATVLALVAGYQILLKVVERLLRLPDEAPETTVRLQRRRTLVSLLRNLAHWVIGFVALVMVLRELGVDVGALLLSAGVVGFAVGFGAQTLIRDLITGFFLLFEGLIGVEDTVEVGAHTGTVEAIGLRVTKLRLLNGAVHVIPNGQLTEFTNYTSGWARAVVEVGVDRTVPADAALATLRRVGEEWAAETHAALDAPEAQGIMRFGGDIVVLRLIVKVDPSRRFDAEADLRRRVKEAFDREQWRLGAP